MNLTGITITGVKISYYFICKSKLWLFSHNIQMEHNSENVKIGKIINESSYGRDKKDVRIDNTICVDFIKKRDGLEIHEIKKSKKMDDAHRWQLIYYLYYLNQKGVDAIGVLNYPLLNKKEIVEARDKDF
ncbi:MAG: Dna2/Cas4 domain-containing protein, partial [Methanosarcinales archaeon]|nr:Dna2/Cas4 domain-containing protein [Methanosarcinales archaeon]